MSFFEKIKQWFAGAEPAAGDISNFTPRACQVLALARMEANRFNHSFVGTEHLLLGLLREEKGIAAQALTDCGVNLEAARTETLRLLGTEMPQGGGASATGQAGNAPQGAAAPAKGGEKKSKTPPTPIATLVYSRDPKTGQQRAYLR